MIEMDEETIEEVERKILEMNRACREACDKTIEGLREFIDGLGFNKQDDLFFDDGSKWLKVWYGLGSIVKPSGTLDIEVKSAYFDHTHLRVIVKLEHYYVDEQNSSQREVICRLCQYFHDEKDLESVDSFVSDTEKAILDALAKWRGE